MNEENSNTTPSKKNRFVKISNEESKIPAYRIESDCMFNGDH